MEIGSVSYRLHSGRKQAVCSVPGGEEPAAVGVCYGLRYPPTLRITTADGREATFKDPKSAKEFVLKELKSM